MLKEWGTEIATRKTPMECRQAIVEFNRILAKLPIPEEVKFGVEFSIHPSVTSVKGVPWYWSVYLKVDEDGTRALSLLPHSSFGKSLSMLTRMHL
jgi:hypothetical protein